jgi:hypothetical protein
MQSLGFENYAEALKIYLAKYREVRYWNTLVWRVIRLLSLLTNWKNLHPARVSIISIRPPKSKEHPILPTRCYQSTNIKIIPDGVIIPWEQTATCENRL